MNIFKKKPEVNIDAEFDIENKQVFCVERLLNGQTVISFTMSDEEGYSVIHDWYIYTTNEQHQTFVNRFSEKLYKEALKKKQEMYVNCEVRYV